MNEYNRIKQIVLNYQNSFKEYDLEKYRELLIKVYNIASGKLGLNSLKEEDIIFLKEKKIIDDSSENLLINFISENKYLNNQVYDLLMKIVSILRDTNKLWEYGNVNNLLLHMDDTFSNMNESDFNLLVDIIIKSSISDLEKNDLLIYLSLCLSEKKK